MRPQWLERSSRSLKGRCCDRLRSYVSAVNNTVIKSNKRTKHQYIHLLTATFKELHIENGKNYKSWYRPHHTDCVNCQVKAVNKLALISISAQHCLPCSMRRHRPSSSINTAARIGLHCTRSVPDTAAAPKLQIKGYNYPHGDLLRSSRSLAHISKLSCDACVRGMLL